MKNSSCTTATIFIVEENAALNRHLQQCFANTGYHVLAADSCLSAIALMDSRREHPVDLLIARPHHVVLHGVELARWLHTSNPDLRYLQLAESAPAAETFRCDSLSLPCENDALLAKVRECLASDLAA